MSRIKQAGGRVFERLLRESGIEAFNGAQGRILYVLWQREGMTISQIARATSLAKTTLTSMLERMQEAGLIERTPDAANRRQVLIRLTDRARGYRADYERISQRMNEIYYQGFTQREVADLEDKLARILENIERTERSL